MRRTTSRPLCAACHLFALHVAGLIRAKGRAPHRIQWEMGRVVGSDGVVRPRRRYLGEFRRERARRRSV